MGRGGSRSKVEVGVVAWRERQGERGTPPLRTSLKVDTPHMRVSEIMPFRVSWRFLKEC